MDTKTKLESINQNGYDINFGEIFNKSFENYKKIALIGGLVFLLMSIVLAAFGFGLMGAFYGAVTMTDFMTDMNLKTMSGVSLIIYIFTLVIVTSLINPIYAGMLKIADCAHQNQEFSIATAFEYYQNAYFKKIFLASLVQSSLSVTITTVAQILGFNIIGALLSYSFSFFMFLTIPFIIFGELNAFEAIAASFNTIKKQIPVLLGLIIVGFLAICLGIFGLCIGIFFTIPFVFSLYYIIYSEIIGINEIDEIDQIGISEN